jgi:peptidoglycan/xylan/chitin deacetylase (PgdA/CDA1 family)
MNFRNVAARIYKSGVKQIANRISTPAAVLIYHRVVDLELDNQLLAVSPANFKNQLDILKEHYNVLLIDEFLYYLTAGKAFPQRSVILTFDDGYYDNLSFALPILEATGLQSLFYISTANIDTNKEFWWDLLEKIFYKTISLPSSLQIQINNHNFSFSTNSLEARINTYNRLHPILKYLHPIIRDEKIKDLLHWSGVENGDAANRVMTTGELVAFSKSNSAIIGAHTHNHPALVSLNYTEQLDEINNSKYILESITGERIKHFSYPFGTKADYNADSIKIMKSVGFEMTCSNFQKLSYSWTNKYEVPRFLVRDWDSVEFKQKMDSFFN